MTKPENSSIRRSKVGELPTNRKTFIMNKGRSGGRSPHVDYGQRTEVQAGEDHWSEAIT